MHLKISKTPRRGRRRGPEGLMCSAEKINLCHVCQHPSQWTHRRENRSIITISGERSSVRLKITSVTANVDTNNNRIKDENVQIQVEAVKNKSQQFNHEPVVEFVSFNSVVSGQKNATALFRYFSH